VSSRIRRLTALAVALVVLLPQPAYAHGGLYAGADNVATVLMAADLGVIAWYRRLRKRARSGASSVGQRRWFLLPLAIALPIAAVTTTSWVPKNLPSKTRPTTTARLQIVAPVPGQVVGPSFTVELKLLGGRIVPLTTTRNRPDEGHIHVSVDGALVSMAAGLRQEVHGLSPGRHLVGAEFVAVDHGPFKSPVVASVTVEVRA
jgi:hypothetical protein